MANETVTEAIWQQPPYYLPLRDVDRGATLCERIGACADLTGEAVEHGEAIPDLAVLTICGLIRDLAEELKAIVGQRVPSENA